MPSPKDSGLSDNSIAALAYLTPVPAFFFLAIRRYNKSIRSGKGILLQA